MMNANIPTNLDIGVDSAESRVRLTRQSMRDCKN